MLTDEEKQVVIYLRASPRDALKKSAADLIDKLAEKLERLQRELHFNPNA